MSRKTTESKVLRKAVDNETKTREEAIRYASNAFIKFGDCERACQRAREELEHLIYLLDPFEPRRFETEETYEERLKAIGYKVPKGRWQ